METKAYFEGTTNNITLEINGHIIRNIPLEIAISRYDSYKGILSQIKKCCLNGDANSISTWKKYSRGLKTQKKYLSAIDDEKYGDGEHHTEHKTLDEILSSIEDVSTKRKIEEVLQHYQQQYGQEVEFLAEGAESTVFGIGDKVIKFGSFPILENAPLTLAAYDDIKYDKYNAMRVFPKLRTGDVSTEDLQTVYNTLREAGYLWKDVKHSNLGWLDGKDGQELRIIDDGDIWSEKQILEDGFTSVLEFLDLREAMFELDYQKTHNPEFDVNNIKKYFCGYDSSLEKQIYVSKLEIEYDKWQKERAVERGAKKTSKRFKKLFIKGTQADQEIIIDSNPEEMGLALQEKGIKAKFKNMLLKIKGLFQRPGNLTLDEAETQVDHEVQSQNYFANEMQNGGVSDREFADNVENFPPKVRTESIDEQEV